ncbi:hypothetical protein LguiB_007257 [Lonicera macranthoides]
MIQEATTDVHHKSKPLLWLSNFKSLIINLPNPSISKLFIVSSATTFSLDILMIIEWILHGRYHSGFRWIIYYASWIVALSALTWFTCLIFAVNLSNNSREPQLIDPLEEDCEMKEEEELVDWQAMVIEQSADCSGGFKPEGGSLILMAKEGEERDENLMIPRRSNTFPLLRTTVQVEGKIKRGSSYCLSRSLIV